MSKALYPEHEKMAKIQDESQLIGDFIDWLKSRSRWKMDALNLGPIDDMLAAYFRIDMGKIEKEKRAMLESCRQARREK